MREFEKLEICNLGPEVMDEIEQMVGVAPVSGHLKWKSENHHGAWISGDTAGGCRNYIGSVPFSVDLTQTRPCRNVR